MHPFKHKLAKEWIYGEASPNDVAKATWEAMDAEFNANRKIQLAEKDNFNTPDLEQSPDSFLRPGETLEDFDVTFRRPNADGGRLGFNDGRRVTNKKRLKQLNEETVLYTDGRYKTFDSLPNDRRLKGQISQRATLRAQGKKVGVGRGSPGTPKDFEVDRSQLYTEETKAKKAKTTKLNFQATPVGERLQWIANNGKNYNNVEDFIKAYEKHFNHKIGSKTDVLFNTAGKKPLTQIDNLINTGRPQQDLFTLTFKDGKAFNKEELFKASIIQNNPDIQKEFKTLFQDVHKNVSVYSELGPEGLIENLNKGKLFKEFDFVKFGVGSGITRRSLLNAANINPDHLTSYQNVRRPLLSISQIIESLKNPSFAKGYGISATTAKKIRGQLENFYEGEKGLQADIRKINNQLGDVKFNQIFGGVNFEHTLAKAFGKDYKYLPRNYLLKGQFTSKAFNMMKRDVFDLPLIELMKKYEKGEVSGAKVQEFINDFNAKTNNYADFSFDVDKGKLGYTDTKVSYDLSRYNNPEVARKEIIDNIKLTQSDTFQTGMKGTIKFDDQLKLFKSKEAKDILSKLEKLGCGRSAGGRILFSNGGGAITTCAKKGVTAFVDNLKNGNYSKATMSILRGGSNFLKNIANPMELLKLRNYIGPSALGFIAAYEGGVITDDVIRQGTPLNESLAQNWLTKAFVPYTQEFAKAKNLLETGKVPSNMKKYVEDVMTFQKSLKDTEAIENKVGTRVVDVGGYGNLDGTSMYSKEQEDKDVAEVIKNMSTIKENVFLPDSAKALEYKSLQDEMAATRMAKPKEFMGIQYSDGFNPIFGFGNLKDRNQKTDFDSYISAVDTQKDLRPVTYMDAKYEDVTTLPAAARKRYENYFSSEEGGNLLKPRQSLSDLKYGNSTFYDELLKDYNKFQRQKEASQYAGYGGTQEPDRFMEGGIASLNVFKK